MKNVYEVLKIVVGVVIGAILVVFVNVNLHLFSSGSTAKEVDITYADLAAINLTVATVVLAAVGLIVGIVAVFGFQIIRSESVENAEKRVLDELPDMLKRELGVMEENGQLTRALERALYSGGSEEENGNG